MSQDYFSPMSSKSDSKKADLLDFGFLSSSLGCESRICTLTYGLNISLFKWYLEVGLFKLFSSLDF